MILEALAGANGFISHLHSPLCRFRKMLWCFNIPCHASVFQAADSNASSPGMWLYSSSQHVLHQAWPRCNRCIGHIPWRDIPDCRRVLGLLTHLNVVVRIVPNFMDGISRRQGALPSSFRVYVDDQDTTVAQFFEVVTLGNCSEVCCSQTRRALCLSHHVC